MIRRASRRTAGAILLFGISIVFVLPASSRSATAAEVQKGPLKWQVVKEGGSGFFDAIWFDVNGDGTFADEEQIVKSSSGKPRILATLAVPPKDGAHPIGLRINWRQLNANVTVAGVEKQDDVVVVSGSLDYADGLASGRFEVRLTMLPVEVQLLKGKSGKQTKETVKDTVINSSLKLTWSKLPQGAVLAEAGFALDTCLNRDQVVSNIGSGRWPARFSGPGFPVSPKLVGSYTPQPTGGSGVRYGIWYQEQPKFARSVHYASSKGKRFIIREGDLTERWCDLSDTRAGVAVVMRGMGAVSPKAFGTLPRSDVSLYAWAWPPVADGMAIVTGNAYTCEGMVWYLHKGRAIHHKYKKSHRHMWGVDREHPDPMRVAHILNRLPAVLPPLGGNIRASASTELLKLPEPEVAWLKPYPKKGAVALPPPAPKPEGKRIPILVSGGDARSMKIEALPYRLGVPFPKGALKDAGLVRLEDASGKEIPLQVERTAAWPDGSVKWVLLDFMAGRSKPSQDLVGYLVWGEAIQRKASPSRPIKATQKDDGTVRVDTGCMAFTVRKGSCGFLETVDLDLNGDGKYAADERVVEAPVESERRNHLVYIHQADLANYLSEMMDIKGDVDPGQAEVQTVAVEAAGPIRATVRLSGVFRHHKFRKIEKLSRSIYSVIPRSHKGPWMPAAATKGTPFKVWLTAWAGKSYIDIAHDFVFEGLSGYQHAASIGLSTRLKLDRTGRKVTLRGAEPGKWISRALADGEEIVDLQASRDLARLYSVRPQGKARTKELLGQGVCASEWLDVSDGRWGLSAGMKDMWEMGPQAIQVSADGVGLHFWPPFGPLWDSRGGGGYTHAFTGVSRTHDAVLHFHKAGEEPEALLGVSRHFTHPAFAFASPWWTCGTRALGLIHPYDPERFPRTERFIHRSATNMRGPAMLQSNRRGQPAITTYGGCNSTEGYAQFGLAIVAARSGWPEAYRAAMAKCRMDAGMCFRKGITRGLRGMTGFTANHPSDWATSFYRSCSDAGDRGIQTMFYLTGDEPLRAFSNWAARAYMKEDFKPKRFRMDSRAGIGHLLWAWERGGKGDYASIVKTAYESRKSWSEGSLRFGDIDMYGAANTGVELYFHSGIEAILDCLRARSETVIAVDVKIQRKNVARAASSAFTLWADGNNSAERLDYLRRELARPPVGGAHWHHLVSEFHILPMTMEALSKHALPERVTTAKAPKK